MSVVIRDFSVCTYLFEGQGCCGCDSPSYSRKMWKNMKNHSKKCLQNENERVIMIDGLFSKGVKRRES